MHYSPPRLLLRLTSRTPLSGFLGTKHSATEIQATGELGRTHRQGFSGCLARRLYSPGRSRRDAAAGPAGVQAGVGDRPRTAGPAPEDSWDTVLGHFGKDLDNH